ncbi:MAG: hypothetical protein KME27_26770 [Lyngbya sp. HA4199-MV5]|jgi:hypothetical protein|nr:hypothetical protein [Lyngbya sp. HA4199-MV5]
MLDVRLDPETEAYLLDIAEREKTTPEVLLKSLIHQHWQRLHPPKTIVERRGGHPEHLLQDASPNLSERDHRKRAIAEYLMKRHPEQSPP